jgi:uncharacterized protein (TIGR02284 family)
MPLSNDEVVDVLNDLLENTRDGEYGFRTCAEEVEAGRLKEVFASRAAQCQAAASQLVELVITYGGKPADGGTATGAMHRGWVHVKGALGANSELSILEECERGEDAAVARYRKALKQPLPVGVRQILQVQAQGAQRNHDQIRDLRNAARAAKARELTTRAPEAAAVSELKRQHRSQVFHRLLMKGAVLPGFERDPLRLREVGLELHGFRGGESLVVDIEVGLVVQAERAVVEVGRAHRHQQAIDHEDLAMEHRRLVFVDLCTGFQQRPPAGARRTAHRLRIDDRSRRDDAQPHAALHGRHQRAHGQVVGHEVRARQVDALRGRGYRQQVHQVHAFAAPDGELLNTWARPLPTARNAGK